MSFKNNKKTILKPASNVVATNTFGANALKFSQEELSEIIAAAVQNTRIAATAPMLLQAKYIALDVGPCGKLLKPYGDLAFEDAVTPVRRGRTPRRGKRG